MNKYSVLWVNALFLSLKKSAGLLFMEYTNMFYVSDLLNTWGEWRVVLVDDFLKITQILKFIIERILLLHNLQIVIE